jgi:hypothetical protein
MNTSSIAETCSFCKNPAAGYNIMGDFCSGHKELFVRDWTKQTLYDLLLEYPNERVDGLVKLFNGYKNFTTRWPDGNIVG